MPLSAQLSGEDDVASAGTGVHNPPEGCVSGPAEVPAPLEGEGELLSHDLCVQGDILDFLNLDLGVLEAEALLDDGGQVLDGLTAAADDKTGPLGGQKDASSQGGPLNIKTSESRTGDLFHEVLLEQDPADVLCDELSL